MTKLNIEGRTYRLKTDFDELTIGDVTALSLLDMPEKLRALIKEPNEKNIEAVIEKDIEVTFPAYYRGVIAALSNIPQQIINRITAEQITNIYKLVSEIIIDIEGLNFEPFAPKSYVVGLDYISHLMSICTETVTIPGYGYTIDQVAQAQDVTTGGAASFVYIPAIYNGWSENKILKFKDRAKRKPFLMAIDFFFSIWQLCSTYLSVTRLFFPAVAKVKRSKVQGCKALSLNLRRQDMVVWLN
jgi:hypothetical protein